MNKQAALVKLKKGKKRYSILAQPLAEKSISFFAANSRREIFSLPYSSDESAKWVAIINAVQQTKGKVTVATEGLKAEFELSVLHKNGSKYLAAKAGGITSVMPVPIEEDNDNDDDNSAMMDPVTGIVVVLVVAIVAVVVDRNGGTVTASAEAPDGTAVKIEIDISNGIPQIPEASEDEDEDEEDSKDEADDKETETQDGGTVLETTEETTSPAI